MNLIVLYILYYKQQNPVASYRLGLALIGVIAMSIFKNMSVILFISIKNSYIKFRTWLHKKINHTERRKQRLKEEAKQRADKRAQLKREKELLANEDRIKKTKVEDISSDRPIITVNFAPQANEQLKRKKKVCPIFILIYLEIKQKKEP